MGGLRALKRDMCHIASSHLLQDNEKEYNFSFASEEFQKMPAVVNFCKREQGILVRKGNPKSISSVADLSQPGMTIVCGDSHTATHGAFGAIAFGIGTSQIRDILATQTMAMSKPKARLVKVNGTLGSGVSAKDIILRIIADLGVRQMRVLSAPWKLTGLAGFGLEVVEYVDPLAEN